MIKRHLYNEGEENSSDFLPPPPPPSAADESEVKSKKKFDDEYHHNMIESFEEVVAGRWFTVIGVIVFVLGLGFLIGFAFKNNWITEAQRIVFGIMVGLVMLGIAEKTFRKYFIFAQVIAGGGVSMFFLSIYYSYNIYHQIPHWVAFFSMMVIVAAGTAISIHHNAPRLIDLRAQLPPTRQTSRFLTFYPNP
ncbi:MAG: DUF2339 domain-containing protein [Candidatus Parcubacteria bacterium]|nr:DUF2339 domain-containing protein [Candidatus Parcubacteria bacterium]